MSKEQKIEKNLSLRDPASMPPLIPIQPLRPSLVVVAVQHPEDLAYARGVIEPAILTGGSDLGLPLGRARPVMSVFSTREELTVAKTFAGPSFEDADEPTYLHTCLRVRRPMDFLTHEGLQIASRLIRIAEPGWISFSQTGGLKSALQAGSALERMRAAAVASGMRVMLFAVADALGDDLPVEDYCDLLLTVDRCEPDLNADHAFSIICPALANLHGIGIGARMCELKVKPGRFAWRLRPFIAAYRRDRYIWISRGQGKSMAAIGKRLKMNKSSIHRRLKKLSPPRRLTLKAGWEDTLLDVSDGRDQGQHAKDHNDEPKHDD